MSALSNTVNCNAHPPYPGISNTPMKRKHLHQMFRPTSNEIMLIMWLYTTNSPLYNWYSNHNVHSIDEHLMIETFENQYIRSYMEGTFQDLS